MNRDLENSKKGIELAEEIIKVMRDEDLSTSLEDYALLKEVLESEGECEDELIKLICDDKALSESVSSFDSMKKLSSSTQFNERLEFKARRKTSLRNSLRYMSSIAAVAAVFCFVVYLFVSKEDVNIVRIVENRNSERITVPTLIGGDGTVVHFETDKMYSYAETEELIGDTARITLNANAALGEGEMRYNKIVVPNKFTFTVRLSDGTEVRLNANSELSYPVSFGQKERKVYLKGEGFFIVAKNEVPFIVSTSRGDAKVYGTRFNMNLNRNNVIQVLLVEGSIGVTLPDSSAGGEVLMKPRQMLECSGNSRSKLLLDNVDVSNYISWLDGAFKYTHIELSDLLQELSSWYGVEFDNRCDIGNMKLSINVNRDMELNKLLNIIESMLNVKFIREKGGLYSVN